MLLGWWWSYGSGAGVARRELCAAMATAELWELGGCCCEEERPRRSKWGRGTARADAGGVKAMPRCIVACADRPVVTRGRCWPPRGTQALSRSATELADLVRQSRTY